jgi:hypothetical protein
VFILDGRVLEPKHRVFLRELPIGDADMNAARLVRGETDRCLREAFAHMGLLAELEQRGLAAPLESD